MTCVFQVNSGPDLATAEEAISIAEQKDSASVVKFNLERNMPDRLPKFVHRSCDLWSFEKNRTPQWQSHYIYDGRGDPMGEELPN